MTTVIELAGVACLVAFAAVVWAPAGLLVGGLALVYVAYALDGALTVRLPNPLRRRGDRS